MQRTISVFLLILLSAGLTWAQDNGRFTGNWIGILTVPGAQLHVVVKIKTQPDGTLTATMDSPDQGATDIPVQKVTAEGNTLRLELPPMMASFTGKLNDKGDTITGDWKQGGKSFPLVLTRTAEAPAVKRPQEPKPPFPYTIEEVTVPNPQAKLTLAGTLTLPTGRGPFPAVVLITGSGPHDRNETLLGHKPFLVLADYLTRRGIAVLRVDDRGTAKSTGNFATATSEDFAGDVLAEVAFLRTRKDIKQIGLLGHSEGGMIAPMVANRTPDVAFVVLLAGTGIPGEQILLMQGELILRANGAPEETIKEQRQLQEQIFRILREEKNDEAARKRLHDLFTERVKALPEAQRKAMGDQEANIQQQINAIVTPWMRFFLTYDPAPALYKLKVPVLALNGSKDLQVPAPEDLKAIGDALFTGETIDVTLRMLPGLNHLFQHATTGSLSEYAQIEETMSPLVLQIIGDWIVQHTVK